jgi:hypothetical protein
LDAGIDTLFNAKFFMKQMGGFNMDEMEAMYPFEFQINYFLTIKNEKDKGES